MQKLGPNCIIFQQVTLAGGLISAPKLAGNVQLGAGAKVLGDICIGDNASIGANAVVLQDIPAGATAVGIPARIVERPRRGQVSCSGGARGALP